MGKLFALENADEGLDQVELETTPEAGEVADVQVDTDVSVDEMVGQADAIEEGIDAGDQMEQVETLVEQASGEEGEGLDPIAAEALKLAIESICHRVGANPKTFHSLYAVENFQSASSRKANTRFALEGVGEFLKDLWKKIKAALQNLWTKVKAFWDKHASSLGRVKKAIESMKAKVSASSGKLDGKAYLEEAPSNLNAAAGFAGDISVKTLEDILAAHSSFCSTSEEILQMTETFNQAAVGEVKAQKGFVKLLSKPTNQDAHVLVGGNSVKIVTEIDDEDVSITIERESVDREKEAGVQLADKNAVKGLLDKLLARINDDIKVKGKMDKMNEAFGKFSIAFEKVITDANPATAKTLRKAMKVVYKINAKTPMIVNEGVVQNLRLSKAILDYSGLCLKHYK